MAKYDVTRRILVRKLGLKAGELVGALVSGPCKRRTAEEQSTAIGDLVSELDEISAKLVELDEGSDGLPGNPPRAE